MSDFNYQTIKSPAEGIFKDKGSKFIAYAYHISNEEDVKHLLTQIKKEHPTARHYCYAWRLGVDKNNYRINDDGEPSGTAGRPILNILLSKGISNIIVFVVRYFGGILLGVPGIINAYKMAAIDVLDNSIIIPKTIENMYVIQFEYLQMNDIMRILKDNNIKILEQEFNNQCKMKVLINKSDNTLITSKLSDINNVSYEFLYTQ